MSLPRDFLTQLEQYSELSNREKAVFLEIFGNGKSRVQVTQVLNISDSNLSSCLTGIYKKFHINGSGPVKETRFREYLQKRYSQQKPADSLTADIVEDDIDFLVQEIREKVKPSIKEKCGTMRVLDMPQPIELTGERGIYTNVNILEKITGRRRLDIPELLHNCNPEHFDRFGLSRVTEKRVLGLEVVQRYSKLMVLGKPGAGKTTFLKYLAMQCIEGQYLTNRVPLFITLKDLAEAPKQPNVLKYIAQQLSSCGVNNASIKADQLLKEGKTLVLLDGLDEVREEDTKRVLRQILDFSEQFHTNQFLITCRIAAKEYTFERFTEVEMADFDQKQIAIFAENWFRLSDPVKGEHFIQKLKDNRPIQELATNPLLLTLLCLVFGESADFPANRSELYKEGLDVLLKKWDAKRNIERDQVYKNLSLHRKEDLLSQIALTTFEQKDYFFKQKTVEAYIADFIRNLRDASTEPKELELDSEAVLRSIEAQHGLLVERAKGIYSFSHLTFQEYFAAREIVANSAWNNLMENATDKRWQEVFLLTAGMMRKADDLVQLMKHKIDLIVALDDNLQKFLRWVQEKSCTIDISYKPVAIRAFYFSLFKIFSKNDYHHVDITLAISLDTDINDILSSLKADDEHLSIANNLSLDFHLIASYSMVKKQFFIYETKNNIYLMTIQVIDILKHVYAYVSEYKLKQSIQKLKDELPSKDQVPNKNTNTRDKLINIKSFKERFPDWWLADGEHWTEQLRLLMIEYRNIGHKWRFSDTQEQLLQQYYTANLLLINCLNSDCYVSREVRQEIENTLLLPMSELKNKN
ncbi:MAG: NACHT domain-containing NTPase [Nostoc sp.]|uniref:NACHT domain-containing protein n=1 Tax=Nostoc sp. TaxID=1180 RepID=UPI002FFBA7DF